jgi:hypothetical protein
MRLGIVVFAAGLAAGQVLYTRVSDRPEIRHDGIASAIWNGHVLIGVEKNRTSAPIVWTLDGSSRKDETRFPIPDAATVNILSLAGAADGTITVAGYTSGGKGFIGIIPPGRGDNMIIRPEKYRPSVITIAPDGVIWTIGGDTDPDKPDKHWFNVLKRFSPSGKLLSSEALKVFGEPNDPIDAATGSLLRSSRDRVGWLTTGKAGYLEYSLDGRETNRFPGPPVGKSYPGVTNVALGDDFEVVAGGGAGKVWTLDRGKGVWNPAQFEGEPLQYAMVFGFEGDQVVMGGQSKNRGFLLVRFSVAPE